MNRIPALYGIALALLLATLLASAGQAQKLDAKIERFRINDVMKGGTSYTVGVDVRNPYDSDFIWQANAGYALVMKFNDGPGIGSDAFNHEELLKYTIEPGEKTSFEWKVDAPPVPGDYEVSVYMTHRGDSFGDLEQEIVTIPEDHAVRISVSGRKSGDPLVEQDLRFRLTNTGTTDWPEARYALQSTLKSAPSGTSREDREGWNFTEPLNLGEWRDEVRPGEDVQVRHSYTYPRTPGEYEIALTLLQNGKPFNIPGHKGSVRVRVLEPDEEVTLQRISDLPRTVQPKRKFRARFTIRNTGDIVIDEGEWGVTCTVKPLDDRDAKKFEFTVLGDDALEAGRADDLREELSLPVSTGEWEFSCKALLHDDDVSRAVRATVTMESN